MNFLVHTHTRDDLIDLGDTLGRIFKASERERPWALTMNKDNKSGKSLVASAIDRVYDPAYYRNNVITPDHYADVLIYDKPNGPTMFLNLDDIYETRAEIDERLLTLQKNFPRARVLVCSNMERSLNGEFNYQAQGLQSERLDLNIDFHVISQPFERKLILTAEDPYLCQSLQAANIPVLKP